MFSRAMCVVRMGAAVVVAAVMLAGCSSPSRKPAVPVDLIDAAIVPGFPEARLPYDINSPQFLSELAKRMEERRVRLGIAPGERLPDAYFLALSGGGQDGAFGAGILCAWSELGTRPKFTVVTGISTGALTAPFAFLGPDYDHVIREMYTTVTDKQIYTKRGLIAGFMGDAMMDSTPLRHLIAQELGEVEMQKIAQECAGGRILLVATTDLDSGRAVIWDIGAIAGSGQPGALDLIREVLLASASIPVAFPPVMFNVEAGGKMYQEMHCDGGAAAQVFIYPAQFNLREFSQEHDVNVKRTMYLIRNSKLSCSPADVERRTMAIAARSIDSMIRTQGVGDLYRMYLESARDGLIYNLAYIPESFTAKPTTMFDPTFMKQLFQVGYDQMKNGTVWHDGPPGFKGEKFVPQG